MGLCNNKAPIWSLIIQTGKKPVTSGVAAWRGSRQSDQVTRLRPAQAATSLALAETDRWASTGGYSHRLIRGGRHRRHVRAAPRARVPDLRRMCGSLAKFTVIPAECPVGGSQLMIICPYPICNASWKSGLGRSCRPHAAALVAERRERGVPMTCGLTVRHRVQVQVAALEAARCVRSA